MSSLDTDDDRAQHFTAKYTDAATAHASAAVVGTLMAIIPGEDDGVAIVDPSVKPSERWQWLERHGVNPDDLWVARGYAFGYYTAEGELIRDGNDERLKALIEPAMRKHRETGDTRIPLSTLRNE